jgi:uncharacterized protein YjiS (DUF1127 family)
MITAFFTRLIAAMARARAPHAPRNMLQLNDRMLRDIGLTRADVIDCLSSAWNKQDDFLHARRKRNYR